METQNIEYKESWRDEYLKWVCGFANAQGGKLYRRFHSNIADLISQEMIEGCIIQMADRVVRMLKDKFLTMPIRYEGLQRIESLEVPEDALREILYNAICHKDYLGPQIQMRVWDHYVEIWNDGELPAAITPENIEKVHASYSRNKNLAFVFYKAGFIESWGRGWQKICDGFSTAGLPKPNIESAQGGVLVTFHRNNVNLPRQNSTDAQNGIDSTLKNTPKSTLKSALKGTPKRLVELIEENPSITIDNVAEALQMNRRGIVKHFKNLQLKGIIRRIGPDNGGHWEIIKEG